MKNLVLVTFLALTFSFSNLALGAINPITQVANQMNTASALGLNNEKNSSQLETTSATLVGNIDGNFYQMSDYGSERSNFPTKLGLLGAAILIGFITHRRMNLNY